MPFESITAALLLDNATHTLGTMGMSDGLRSVLSKLLKRSWDEGNEYDVSAMLYIHSLPLQYEITVGLRAKKPATGSCRPRMLQQSHATLALLMTVTTRLLRSTARQETFITSREAFDDFISGYLVTT